MLLRTGGRTLNTDTPKVTHTPAATDTPKVADTPTVTHRPTVTATAKVTCLGEAMAVLIPDGDALSDELGYTLSVGGAEANVACSLAALGVPARWVSRVGDDRFGRVVLRTLAERGVDVSDVEVDSTRLTGLYVKEITPPAPAPAPAPSPAPAAAAAAAPTPAPTAVAVAEPVTRMRYYRAGSAACAMGPHLAKSPALRDTPLLHLSGITPALSESCAALIEAILAEPQPGRIVSFDVNLRPALWSGRDPAILLSLARCADLVFLGADEAAAICGVHAPDELRRLLPEPRTLVVKQGADGAVGFEGSRRVRVPALPVEVAEATGAGDAFAAGFIAGTLRGLSLRDRLRLGTLAAASVLRVRDDFGAMPTPTEIAGFLAEEAEEAPEEEEAELEPGVAAGSEVEVGAG